MAYKQSQNRKKRLVSLYNKTKYSYGAGAWYDEDRDLYIRYSCHNRWLRKHCRRITRRRLNRNYDQYPESVYKKIYDYWWELL